MYSKLFISVFYVALFVVVQGQTDDWVTATQTFTTVTNFWDQALNADANTTLLNSATNSLSSSLTLDVSWSTPYTNSILSGRNAVINNLKTVEGPKITASTRVVGSPRAISNNLITQQISYLVTHYQTLVADSQNPLPRTFSQVERFTITFRRQLLSSNWLISDLSYVVVQSEKDDLIDQIIALQRANEDLNTELNSFYSTQQQSATYLETLKTVYQGVIYPNQIAIIQQGIVPHVFSNSVRGRIHPIGTFSDLEGTVEYFYALSPVSSSQRIVNVTITKFSNVGKVAATEAIFTFQNPTTGVYLANMTQKGFWRFDDDGLVIEYDLELLNLELRQQALGRNSSDPAYRASFINSICTNQNNVCTGNNTQYANIAACVAFMNTIDFGTTDRYWANSVQCRSIHLSLAAIRPAYHCPHVGVTGGGKCVNIDYNSLYLPLFPTQPRLIG
jgi:hypothetical protein